MSREASLELPLYPAVVFRRSLWDKLLGRWRLAYEQLGTVSASATKLVYSVHGRSQTVWVNEELAVELGAKTIRGVDVLSLQLISPAAGEASFDCGFRVGLPEGTLRGVGLVERETLFPAVTTQDFRELWFWLKRAGEACSLELPRIDIPTELPRSVRTPGTYARCSGCLSLEVLVRGEGKRCLACGYETASEEQQRRDQEAREQQRSDEIAKLSDAERWRMVLKLLADAERELAAYLPDFERAFAGQPNNRERMAAELTIVSACQSALRDVRQSVAYAPEAHLVEPALSALSFVSDSPYLGRAMEGKMHTAIRVIGRVKGELESGSAGQVPLRE